MTTKVKEVYVDIGEFSDQELLDEVTYRFLDISPNLSDVEDEQIEKEFYERNLGSKYLDEDLLRDAVYYFNKGNIEEGLLLLHRAIPELNIKKR